MKKFALFLISLMIGLTPLVSVRKALAAGPNLISNASAETQNASNANLPADWTKDQWGTITPTFTYNKTAANAQEGSKSLYTQITARTSGDIKWSHKEVTVTPSTSYTFSDYYKSNVASEIVVQTLGTNNAYTYQSLKAPAIAANWTQNNIVFTTTATAKAITVFHLINKVGWMYTDNYFLGLTNVNPTAPTVALSAPAANATVSNSVTVTATASDSAGIAGVQFMLDGVALGAEDKTSPYSISWNTKTATNGTHNVTAVARSKSGATKTSTPVSVTVNNVAAPTVSVSAPATNSTLSGTVAVSAAATNAVGVQFKLDGVALGAEDISSPFSVNWDTKTATNGTHSLTATARNSAGVTVTSNAISVTVNNVPAPTISIAAPAANATVSGNLDITTNTTGTVGVQFFVDEVAFGSEDVTAPFSTVLDTKTLTNATHSLRAVARNSVNQTVSSAAVSITVNNTVVTPPTPATNLIANPSMETADTAGTKPLSWLSGNWGTNTPVYTYETTGRTGSRSVKTQITNYTSGDAKWYFAPVDVTAGKVYDYSHYFKSSASTDIVAQYTDASGNNTYQYLATMAPSTAWQLFTQQLTAPATAKKVTILHVLYSVGTLQLDDASLALNTPAPVDTAVIKNGSFETASSNPNLPSGWETGSWGSNSALYEYLNEAYSGARSVKLTLTNYVDGDAKWFFTPVSSLASGNMYRFSTRYKTNTVPKAVAQFNKADGSSVYFGMPNPQPNGTSDWQYYSDSFTVPEGVTGVTVFFLLNSNGYVQMDDQAIVDYVPVGFNRPLLTLTFDDGFEDNNQTVLPMTGAYGIKTTQCYASQFVQENSTNPQLVLDFKNAGHEICSHTITHPFLTSLNTTQLTTELRDSQAYLQSLIGTTVPNFASPYGDYNQAVNAEIKKYYRSHRTVDEGFNSKDNFDIYRIRVQNILSTTTASQVKSWVDQAKATNTWLVLVYHKVSNTEVGPFDSYTADFAAQLKAISDSGITVKTYGAALDEVTAQL